MFDIRMGEWIHSENRLERECGTADAKRERENDRKSGTSRVFKVIACESTQFRISF